MKYFIYIITILLLTSNIYNSQNLQVDYVINKKAKNNSTEVMYTLLIDHESSLFYNTSKCQDIISENSFPKLSSEIIVAKSNDIKIYDKIGKYDFYIISDANLKWNITKEEKIENGYKLKKAEVNYNEKKWIAWFFESIPIPEGPFIFKGLPGLIYSINDTENLYKIEMFNLQENKKQCNFDFSKYKILTFEKYKTLIETTNINDGKLIDSFKRLNMSLDGENLNEKADEMNLLRDIIL